MSGHGKGSSKVQSLEPEQINEGAQVLGSQVWRVVPYAFRYPRRLVAGFLGNACARVVDLVPFVAIGWAVDYFTSDIMVGPMFVHDAINAIHSEPALGYGVMLFTGFVMLAFSQGLSDY